MARIVCDGRPTSSNAIGGSDGVIATCSDHGDAAARSRRLGLVCDVRVRAAGAAVAAAAAVLCARPARRGS
jgi:hypothetical protein